MRTTAPPPDPLHFSVYLTQVVKGKRVKETEGVNFAKRFDFATIHYFYVDVLKAGPENVSKVALVYMFWVSEH